MGKLEILPNMINPLEISYTQLSTRFNQEYGILWTEMNPSGIPCCTKELLDDLYNHHKDIESCGGQIRVRDELYPVRYSVVASLVPGAFNLGGHLGLFGQLIKNKDCQALLDYSIVCLDVMFSRISHFNLPLVTISLIQGDALGGGLEAALTSDVIIAERNTKMGFPEILFNLIPGHGAFSLVARKIGAAQAEKMILSGRIYRAEELYDLGLVDVLVEDGQGENAVYEYVRKQSHCSNGYRALKMARNRFNPITYQEMMDITTIWANAALHLDERDLKVMNRFLRSQQKIYGQNIPVQDDKILSLYKLEGDFIAA